MSFNNVSDSDTIDRDLEQYSIWFTLIILLVIAEGVSLNIRFGFRFGYGFRNCKTHGFGIVWVLV